MKIDESALDNILRNHLTDVSNSRPTMMDWFFISSVGSMNYSLDDNNSDVDSKLVLIPSMYEIIHSESMVSREKDVSRAFYHGICSVYDMRKYFSYLLKQNPNFAYCDPMKTISCLREMANQEFIRVVESDGEDSKAAYHCLRIYSMLSDFYRGKPYKDILPVGDGPFGELILKIKQGKQNADRVQELCDKFHQNEGVEYSFFVDSRNSPREWDKGIFFMEIRGKIDDIQAKLIRKANRL